MPGGIGLLFLQVEGQVHGVSVVDFVQKSQVEGVVKKLCPVVDRNDQMIGFQLFTDQVVIGWIVLDAVIAYKIGRLKLIILFSKFLSELQYQ